MRRDEIEETLSDLVQRELGVQAAGGAAPRIEQFDSLQRLQLAVAIEDRFRICLEADEEAISTVGDLVSLIERKLHER